MFELLHTCTWHGRVGLLLSPIYLRQNSLSRFFSRKCANVFSRYVYRPKYINKVFYNVCAWSTQLRIVASLFAFSAFHILPLSVCDVIAVAAVICGMTVVTWFDGSTNQRHSALSIPHFTFRIPQFRILPTTADFMGSEPQPSSYLQGHLRAFAPMCWPLNWLWGSSSHEPQ